MNIKFCGQTVSKNQLSEIQEIVSTFPLISRTELANTVAELFSWKRPTGRLKTVECRQFLEQLDDAGIIQLPACKTQYRKSLKQSAIRFNPIKSHDLIKAELSSLMPIELELVKTTKKKQTWREYVGLYHYIGLSIPFGAHLSYFIQSNQSDNPIILGCFQFSSPAWKVFARDEWIGWDDSQRQQYLQRIVNNSRFLIFPWIQVKNLASYVLSIAAKIISKDWHDTFGYKPILLETFVDENKFTGTCYEAANWIYVGKTKGRGRMDIENKGQKVSVKKVFVYPLVRNFREALSVRR